MSLRQQYEQVNAVLNEWDFIGVTEDGILDEYECLCPPLVHRLVAGQSTDDISRYLRKELSEHFGVDPEGDEVHEVASRLLARAHTWQLDEGQRAAASRLGDRAE